MESKTTESKPRTLKQTAQLLLGGAGAGVIAFALFGGIWQVNHFWWVMAATIICCSLLALCFRQNFESMLDALADNIPWL
ncbi:MAG: hypothetical protein F6K14_16730 [Symploca sp. SIO2C1]|nr:hypothetical protein [Symploca sp. SIO2C1]